VAVGVVCWGIDAVASWGVIGVGIYVPGGVIAIAMG